MAPIGEPTVRRKRLGNVLRELRKSAGFTQAEAAEEIGKANDMISRVEAGRQNVDIPLLRALLDVYRVDDSALREALEAMARNIGTRGWWHSYRSSLPAAHQDFLGLEADASAFAEWEPDLIPGLLQVRPYTKAVLMAGQGILYDDAEELDTRVRVRMERKQLLDNPQFALEAIIGARALHTRPADIMREQLESLLADADRPNVSVRVMPLDSEFHLGMTGAFTIIRFPDGGRLVAQESMADTAYFDDTSTLDMYDAAFDQMRQRALTESASRDLIRECIRTL